MAESLKPGLVGADASGRAWGPVAHMPALAAIDSIELAAVCTSRPESAAAAGEAYGIDRAYHDIGDLAAQPDIDIVSVVVRVPQHDALVMAALDAGRHVCCEWPLGATLAEAEEMATLAQAKGVTTAVGRQGQVDTGETVDVDAPDNILVTGVLSSGGLLSYYAASVPHHGPGWRLEAYGTKGTLVASTPGLPQITPVTLRGAQHGKPLSDLAVPDRLQPVLDPAAATGQP